MKQHRHIFLLLLLLVPALLITSACGDDDDDDNDDANDDDDDTGDDDTEDDDDDDDDTDTWTPVEPHTETHGRFTIAWYNGTPYEMGYQQGTLLHDQLAAGVQWLESMAPVDVLVGVLKTLGLVDIAMANSYPDIIEECQGISDAASDVGWSKDLCILLNFGDALVEFLAEGYPGAKEFAPGCTEIIAAGDATTDGRLYHGRILDWSKIDFMVDYPVIHVRQPKDGIPHAYIGFPGNLSPYSGINAAGVSIASNEADPKDASQQSATGHSHVQMLGQLLKTAHSLEEARQIIEDENHMVATIFAIADGNTREASVFEMTAALIGERPLDQGVVWATNHFVDPVTQDADKEPAGESSLLRFDRAEQLLTPQAEESRWGELNPQTMIEVMRDRVNPYTHVEAAADVFDNDGSLATNGALYQIVFDPENLLFWVAAGALPVPAQPFTGFSLGELLGLDSPVPCEPAIYE